MLMIGNGSSGEIAQMNNTRIHFAIEADSGAVYDLGFNVNSSYIGGIQDCYGEFITYASGGTVSAGTQTGDFQAQIFGNLSSPCFTSTQLLTTIGGLSIWTNYAQNISPKNGYVQFNNSGGGGPRQWGGSGAPSRPGGNVAYLVGDRYSRTDTPTISNQRDYIVTAGCAAGNTPTWSGIL